MLVNRMRKKETRLPRKKASPTSEKDRIGERRQRPGNRPRRRLMAQFRPYIRRVRRGRTPLGHPRTARGLRQFQYRHHVLDGCLTGTRLVLAHHDDNTVEVSS